jgi:hypothetical protein
MAQRISAAAAAGLEVLFAPPGERAPKGLRIVPVHHVSEALTWAEGRSRPAPSSRRRAERGPAQPERGL